MNMGCLTNVERVNLEVDGAELLLVHHTPQPKSSWTNQRGERECLE